MMVNHSGFETKQVLFQFLAPVFGYVTFDKLFMKVIVVPTSKSYDGTLSYLQRAWHSAWHIPNG